MSDPLKTLISLDRTSAPISPGPASAALLLPTETAGRKKGFPVWAIILVVLGGLFLMFSAVAVIGIAGGSGDPKAGFTTMPAAPAAEKSLGADKGPAAYTVGKTFLSGDFQYTFHGVKTGLTQVGGQYNRQKAQGVYTRLDVTVKNVGDQPMYFDADGRIKVEDAAGRQFSADGTANIFGNKDLTGWYTELNPGNSIRAYAFYDLPKGVKAVRAVVSTDGFLFDRDVVVTLA